MAAKRLLFEGASVPNLASETTRTQHAALTTQLAAHPGCIMRAWQRTDKGWINAEIALPNDEFFKFRVDHRAVVANVRIERAPESASTYQKRYENNPDAHRHMMQALWSKRQNRKDLFNADI